MANQRGRRNGAKVVRVSLADCLALVGKNPGV